MDVGKDGVCDCLRIGTLGQPGEWGDGNVFAAWLDARAAQGAVALGDQEINATTLGDLQVIVVQNVSEIGRDYSEVEVQALDAWIRAGGGLMTLIGYADSNERANVNRLLVPSGLSYAEQIPFCRSRVAPRFRSPSGSRILRAMASPRSGSTTATRFRVAAR